MGLAKKAKPKRWSDKQRKVIAQLAVNPNLKECAEVTGAAYGYVRNLVTKPDFYDAVEAGRKKFALKVDAQIRARQKKAAIDAADILLFTKKIYDRCMQEEPVLDKDGNPTGEYTFDSSGANKAVKTMGDHITVRAFVGNKDDVPEIPPSEFEWKVTVVHMTKDEFDRGNGKPPIEHQP